MDINNNTNISTQIANSISKLNLNTAKRTFEAQKSQENTSNIELQSIKKDDISLIDEQKVQQNARSNGINVEEIQKYANSIGENLSIDDINYGLMYGRSVVADFSA